MWGNCRGQAVTSPTETKFSKINNVFACFSSPPLMYRPLFVGMRMSFLLSFPACLSLLLFSIFSVSFKLFLLTEFEDLKTVGTCVGEAFNDQETSDLTFMIDGKPVYVHKAMLKIRYNDLP